MNPSRPDSSEAEFIQLMRSWPVFFAELRRVGFHIDVEHYSRVQELLLRLAVHGQLPSSFERLETLLAPIVCSSPAEQEEFGIRYKSWTDGIGDATSSSSSREAPLSSASSDLEREVNRSAKTLHWLRFAFVTVVSVGLIWMLIANIESDLPEQPVGRVSPGSSSDTENEADLTRKDVIRHDDADNDYSSVSKSRPTAWPWGYQSPRPVRGEYTSDFWNFPHSSAEEQDDQVGGGGKTTIQGGSPERHPQSPDDHAHQEAVAVQKDLEFEEPPSTRLHNYWTEAIVLILVLLVVSLFCLPMHVWWWRAQARLFLVRNQTDGPVQLDRLLVDDYRDGLYRSLSFHSIAQRLRYHKSITTNQLDVDQTILASVDRAGLFEPRYCVRRAIPEYLVLIDCKTRHDQQASRIDDMVSRLQECGNIVQRFYFSDDPRYCLPSQMTSLPVSLVELANRFPEHRLIVFSDGDALIDSVRARPATWLPQFNSWNQRYLMTCEPQSTWSLREKLLTEHFTLFPATEVGIRQLVEILTSDVVAPFSAANKDTTFPNLLRERELRWLVDTPPQPSIQEQLDEQVHDYLDDVGMFWLRSAAVYPELNLNLLLYLGTQLADRHGNPLFDEERLVALARLPWIRHGRMPEWLRHRLIEGLDASQRTAVYDALEQLLLSSLRKKSGVPLEIVRPKNPPLKRLYQALTQAVLKRCPAESPLSDRVFATFLRRRSAFPLPPALKRVLRPARNGWILRLFNSMQSLIPRRSKTFAPRDAGAFRNPLKKLFREQSKSKKLRLVNQYTLSFLAIVVGSIAFWQLFAPRAFRPLDLLVAWVRHDDWHLEDMANLKTIVESIAEGDEHLSDRQILEAFDRFGNALEDAKETEKPLFRSWNTILMDEALATLQRRLLNCRDVEDAQELEDGLVGTIDSHLSKIDSIGLAEDKQKENEWRRKLTLAQARLRRAVQGESEGSALVLQATLAEENGPGQIDEQRGFVRNPFREGGAEAAWALLNSLCNEAHFTGDARSERPRASGNETNQLGAVDDEVLAVAAAAAFFKDSPNYLCAAGFADTLLRRYEQDNGKLSAQVTTELLPYLVNCLLISAHSHASRVGQADAAQYGQAFPQAAAIHSISQLADWFRDGATRRQGRISDTAYFEKLVDGIRLAENSNIGALIQQVRENSGLPSNPSGGVKPATFGQSTTASLQSVAAEMSHDAATIYAAAAAFLPSLSANHPPTVLEQRQIRPVYFLIASRLEPGNAQHLVDHAVATLGLPSTYNNPEDELRFLKDVTDKIGQIDDAHPGKSLVQGRLYVLEARRAASRKDQVQKYRDALDCLHRLETGEIRPQYQTTWELTSANAKLELANAFWTLGEDIAEIRRLLEEAIGHCEHLNNMAEEQKSLLYMPFVYMAWGNALEDLQYLARIPGKYKEAIKIFETGRDEAIQKGDARRQDSFDFSIARCIFRLAIFSTEETTDQYSLNEAERLLKQIVGVKTSADLASINVSEISGKRLFAASCLYLARIYERHALKEHSAEQRLDKLERSADFLEQAVATAYAAGLRERYFWKLEYAETAVYALSIADISQQEHEKWTRRAKRAVDDILAGSDSMMSTDTVLREHCRIALSAVVKVLMWGLVLDRNEILEYAVTDKIPDSDSDIRAHLVLRQAQYACDKLSDYDDREKTREIVEQDLSRAQSIVDTLPDVSLGESRDIWAARIAGQRAILEYRIFWLSLRDRNVSEKDSSKLGVAAFEKLNHVTEIFEQLSCEAAQQDAAYLRYLQGLIAVRIRDANLGDLVKKAKGELNRIAKDEWDSRAAALCKKTDVLEGWSWGVWEATALTHLPKPPEWPHKRPKEYASTVIAVFNDL